MDLNFKDELLYYDGPLAFTATDANGSLYFVSMHDHCSNPSIYVAAPVTESEIENFSIDKISDYLNKDEWYVVLMDGDGMDAVRRYTPITETEFSPL